MKISEERVKQISELEKILKVNFKDKNLINQALIHRSFKDKKSKKPVDHNERLEFFGDAVLKLAVSQELFKNFPAYSEGELTKLRAYLVSDAALNEVAKSLKLGQYLLLGESEKRAKEFNRASILAAALEAVFGAIYWDRGYEKSQQVIIGLLEPKINQMVQKQEINDFKSVLQEEVQKKGWPLPHYQVVKEKGPEHRKIFYVEVRVGEGKFFIKGLGKGPTKKSAEQFAAKETLEKLFKLAKKC